MSKRAAEWTVGTPDGKRIRLKLSRQTLTPHEAARLRNQLTEILYRCKGRRGLYVYRLKEDRDGMALIARAAESLRHAR